jgi:hypothetical protein
MRKGVTGSESRKAWANLNAALAKAKGDTA